MIHVHTTHKYAKHHIARRYDDVREVFASMMMLLQPAAIARTRASISRARVSDLLHRAICGCGYGHELELNFNARLVWRESLPRRSGVVLCLCALSRTWDLHTHTNTAFGDGGSMEMVLEMVKDW